MAGCGFVDGSSEDAGCLALELYVVQRSMFRGGGWAVITSAKSGISSKAPVAVGPNPFASYVMEEYMLLTMDTMCGVNPGELGGRPMGPVAAKRLPRLLFCLMFILYLDESGDHAQAN